MEVPSGVLTSVIVAVHMQPDSTRATDANGGGARFIEFVGNRIEDLVASAFEERLEVSTPETGPLERIAFRTAGPAPGDSPLSADG